MVCRVSRMRVLVPLTALAKRAVGAAARQDGRRCARGSPGPGWWDAAGREKCSAQEAMTGPRLGLRLAECLPALRELDRSPEQVRERLQRSLRKPARPASPDRRAGKAP